MTARLRILYHHRTLGDGAEGIHIEAMVSAFRRLGHDVQVISLMATGVSRDAEKHRHVWRIVQRLPRALYEVAEVGYNLKGHRDVNRAIRGYRPDLVYDRYNLYNDAVVAAARRSHVPVFLEVNTPYAYQRRVYERLVFGGLASWMEARTWMRADRVLVVSTPLKRYVLEAGVPEDRVDVVPNGVDLELFDEARVREGAYPPLGQEGRTRIGYVGSLRRWHGLELLMEAAVPLLEADRNLRIVVVGDGPERGGLEERAKSLGVKDSVEFLGWVPHEKIPSFIAGFDVAVSPKNVFYQSPMKILEYMAMGKAILAPDSENIHDLIEGGREGLLFRPDDAGSLREALRRVVADPALRARLGAEARRRVELRHTWLANAQRVIQRWEELMTARAGTRSERGSS